MDLLTQILLLLGATVAIVALAQRAHVPTSLAYLIVGLVLSPHTVGPKLDVPQLGALAEYGIVFLLFTIGLSYSLPQLRTLRGSVLRMGTGQVALTTAVIGLAAWWLGAAPAVAFVIGAVCAQSSSTIIGKQLAEQGEDGTRHGRLGLAISVFQDVTAVPFVVLIPVLAVATDAAGIGRALGMAFLEGTLATLVVFGGGRWVVRPLFRLVTRTHSAELFTLTVLLVALVAAAITNRLGLSLAFGAFLAGMVLGETEFRHQVESTIRPFRDVLLGLFFVGIGMMVDVRALREIWSSALGWALAMIIVKTLIVGVLLRRSGEAWEFSWRTGLLVGVGGEFGLALVAIGLEGGVLDARQSQVLLSASILAMVAGLVLIRFNGRIAGWLARQPAAAPDDLPRLEPDQAPLMRDHAIIGGYGRIGQAVGHLLAAEGLPYIAVDLDGERVRRAHVAGEPVFFGDVGDPRLLESLGLAAARMLVIAHGERDATLRLLAEVRALAPHLPVMVRVRDAVDLELLLAAGATLVVPETLEAGLVIAAEALRLLGVDEARVARLMRDERAARYPSVREVFDASVVPQGGG